MKTIANAVRQGSLRSRILYAVAILAGALLLVDTVRTGDGLIAAFPKHLVFMGLTYSTLALSLNFVTGYVGQVSLGHAAFFGVGAYASALLSKLLGLSFWLALPAAGVAAGLLAIPLGLPSVRVKGPFLVVVTYGLCEVLRFTAINLDITGGPSGMPGLPAPRIGVPLDQIGTTGKEAYIVLALLLVWLVAFTHKRISTSRFGLNFFAVKDDEIAAGAMGINPTYFKILALVIAGVFAGLAGSLYGHYTSFINPDVFSANESILMLSMMVVGGTGTIWGPITGAFALILLPQVLHWLKDLFGLTTDPWMTLFGLILIVLMRYRPEGLGTQPAGARASRG